jgi:hypothetical protein
VLIFVLNITFVAENTQSDPYKLMHIIFGLIYPSSLFNSTTSYSKLSDPLYTMNKLSSIASALTNIVYFFSVFPSIVSRVP